MVKSFKKNDFFPNPMGINELMNCMGWLRWIKRSKFKDCVDWVEVGCGFKRPLCTYFSWKDVQRLNVIDGLDFPSLLRAAGEIFKV